MDDGSRLPSWNVEREKQDATNKASWEPAGDLKFCLAGGIDVSI